MWYNAKIRDASVGIPVGTKVLVRKSDEKHVAISTTWWIYDGVRIRQVAESFGGHDIYQVAHKTTVFSDQARMDARFRPLHRAYLRNRSKPVNKPPKTVIK